MEWEKLGNIFNPKIGFHPKLYTHASNPLPLHLNNNIYRIYYNGRDKQNRSSIGAIEYDIISRKLIKYFKQPLFIHDNENSYYSDGVSIGCQYSIRGNIYMLFMGWKILNNGFWQGEIGRLKIEDDGSLTYRDDGPLFSIDTANSISLSYPFVAKNSNGKYKMWYGSTITRDAGNGEMLHVISNATSIDGIKWIPNGLAIPFEIGVAQAFSKPCIIKNKYGLEMWYSYRGNSDEKYCIGYAKSLDGEGWEIDNSKAGINVSDLGWDSEMVCYPYVFNHKGNRYMLYNGNGFGKTGFGLAVLKNDS
jgi:hypothetical protein